jgi:hypothetical protein
MVLIIFKGCKIAQRTCLAVHHCPQNSIGFAMKLNQLFMFKSVIKY